MYGEDLLDVIIEMVLDASLSSFSPVGTVLETIVDDECFLWYADVTCSLVWEEGIGSDGGGGSCARALCGEDPIADSLAPVSSSALDEGPLSLTVADVFEREEALCRPFAPPVEEDSNLGGGGRRNLDFLAGCCFFFSSSSTVSAGRLLIDDVGSVGCKRAAAWRDLMFEFIVMNK